MLASQYRIMQRAPGGTWVVWMGKEFGELEKAEASMKYVLDMARFFRWTHEYKMQSRPIDTEWSDVESE